MKKRLSYRIPLTNSGFDVTVRNTATGIELSDLKEIGSYRAYGRPEQIVERLLVWPYRTIRYSDRKAKKQLAKDLLKKIDKLQEEIEEARLLIQCCRKKKVTLIKSDSNEK